ncbi:MAG: hypothetical protein IJU93_01590 [Lachnospiraceae bacterium]|nr:hypothetical protein [Lachnospiraceae bacterium]
MINEYRLPEDDLDNVSGGMQADQASDGKIKGKAVLEIANSGVDTCRCPECGEVSRYEVLSGGRRRCSNCGRVYELSISALENPAAYEA